MADSTTNLDLIAVGQADKEDLANELFDAASPAMLYGRHASTCTGLTWGYYGGRFDSTAIANGTLSLTLNSTCYIVASRVDGSVSFSIASTNWDDTDNYIRCYKVVTGASTVTSYEDHRQAIWPWPGASSSSGMGGGFTTLEGYSYTLTEIDAPPVSLDY